MLSAWSLSSITGGGLLSLILKYRSACCGDAGSNYTIEITGYIFMIEGSSRR